MKAKFEHLLLVLLYRSCNISILFVHLYQVIDIHALIESNDGQCCNFQSDESIYERECGNMPGFAVYYRYPNSQRVTYGQFIKVVLVVQLLSLYNAAIFHSCYDCVNILSPVFIYFFFCWTF